MASYLRQLCDPGESNAEREAEQEITSADSLNLALKAKSLQARIWWWLVTVVASISFLAVLVLLTVKYNEYDTTVLTRLKRSRQPFPAVTFCNMNPYKRSAVAAVPEVAALIQAYLNSTKNTTSHEESTQSLKRNKRGKPTQQQYCYSSHRSGTRIILNNREHEYDLYDTTVSSWDEGFKCCEQFAFVGETGRLARLDGPLIISYLTFIGMINASQLWIGMSGSSGVNYWYENSTTIASAPFDASSLCGNCALDSSQASGGPVTVTYSNSTVTFHYKPPTFNASIQMLCESYGGLLTTMSASSTTSSNSGTTSSSSMTSTTTTSTLITSLSASSTPSTTTAFVPLSTTMSSSSTVSALPTSLLSTTSSSSVSATTSSATYSSATLQSTSTVPTVLTSPHSTPMPTPTSTTTSPALTTTSSLPSTTTSTPSAISTTSSAPASTISSSAMLSTATLSLYPTSAAALSSSTSAISLMTSSVLTSSTGFPQLASSSTAVTASAASSSTAAPTLSSTTSAQSTATSSMARVSATSSSVPLSTSSIGTLLPISSSAVMFAPTMASFLSSSNAPSSSSSTASYASSSVPSTVSTSQSSASTVPTPALFSTSVISSSSTASPQTTLFSSFLGSSSTAASVSQSAPSTITASTGIVASSNTPPTTSAALSSITRITSPASTTSSSVFIPTTTGSAASTLSTTLSPSTSAVPPVTSSTAPMSTGTTPPSAIFSTAPAALSIASTTIMSLTSPTAMTSPPTSAAATLSTSSTGAPTSLLTSASTVPATGSTVAPSSLLSTGMSATLATPTALFSNATTPVSGISSQDASTFAGMSSVTNLMTTASTVPPVSSSLTIGSTNSIPSSAGGVSSTASAVSSPASISGTSAMSTLPAQITSPSTLLGSLYTVGTQTTDAAVTLLSAGIATTLSAGTAATLSLAVTVSSPTITSAVPQYQSISANTAASRATSYVSINAVTSTSHGISATSSDFTMPLTDSVSSPESVMPLPISTTNLPMLISLTGAISTLPAQTTSVSTLQPNAASTAGPLPTAVGDTEFSSTAGPSLTHTTTISSNQYQAIPATTSGPAITGSAETTATTGTLMPAIELTTAAVAVTEPNSTLAATVSMVPSMSLNLTAISTASASGTTVSASVDDALPPATLIAAPILSPATPGTGHGSAGVTTAILVSATDSKLTSSLPISESTPKGRVAGTSDEAGSQNATSRSVSMLPVVTAPTNSTATQSTDTDPNAGASSGSSASALGSPSIATTNMQIGALSASNSTDLASASALILAGQKFGTTQAIVGEFTFFESKPSMNGQIGITRNANRLQTANIAANLSLKATAPTSPVLQTTESAQSNPSSAPFQGPRVFDRPGTASDHTLGTLRVYSKVNETFQTEVPDPTASDSRASAVSFAGINTQGGTLFNGTFSGVTAGASNSDPALMAQSASNGSIGQDGIYTIGVSDPSLTGSPPAILPVIFLGGHSKNSSGQDMREYAGPGTINIDSSKTGLNSLQLERNRNGTINTNSNNLQQGRTTSHPLSNSSLDSQQPGGASITSSNSLDSSSSSQSDIAKNSVLLNSDGVPGSLTSPDFGVMGVDAIGNPSEASTFPTDREGSSLISQQSTVTNPDTVQPNSPLITPIIPTVSAGTVSHIGIHNTPDSELDNLPNKPGLHNSGTTTSSFQRNDPTGQLASLSTFVSPSPVANSINNVDSIASVPPDEIAQNKPLSAPASDYSVTSGYGPSLDMTVPSAYSLISPQSSVQNIMDQRRQGQNIDPNTGLNSQWNENEPQMIPIRALMQNGPGGTLEPATMVNTAEVEANNESNNKNSASDPSLDLDNSLSPAANSALRNDPDAWATGAGALSSNASESNPGNKNEAHFQVTDILHIQTALESVRSDFIASSLTSQDILPYIMASLPAEIAIRAGYKFDDLIIDCVYNGVACGEQDFRLLVDPNYGNCYTFNAWSEHETATRAGFERGLTVTYMVEQDQYMDFIQTAGIRLAIHDQNDTVLPDAFGIHVAGGCWTSAAIKKSTTNSYSSPSRRCAKTNSDVPIYNYVNTSYTTEACLRSCYQSSVIEKCQCGDPRIPLPPNSNFSYCNPSKRDCVNMFYEMEGGSINQCDCPKECQLGIHDVTLSTTKWTHKKESDVEAKAPDGPKHEFSRISVYYEDLTIVEYIESAVYGMPALLLDLSSIIGLLLGVSVLSMFELVNLVAYIWNTRPPQQRQRSPSLTRSVLYSSPGDTWADFLPSRRSPQ